MGKSGKRKIAHFSLNFGCTSGIINKLENLAKTSDLYDLGIDFYCLPCYDYNLSTPKYLHLIKLDNKKRAWKMPWYRFKQILYINKIAHCYEKITLRYTMFDPLVWLFLKNKNKIFLEHHGKEEFEMKVVGDFRYFFEKWLGGWFLRLFAGSISVTEEIKKYESKRSKRKGKAYIFPNSISCDNIDFKVLDKPVWDSDILNIGMVANFWPWHGLSRILEEFEIHPELTGKVVLHLVGNIKDNGDLKKIKDLKNVVYYGAKDKEWLGNFYPKINLGVGSFNMKDQNLIQSSSLKIREYLKEGIPVVQQLIDNSFPENFSFILQLDNSFDLQKVYEFAQKIKDTSRADVARAARPYIDSKKILQRLREELLSS